MAPLSRPALRRAGGAVALWSLVGSPLHPIRLTAQASAALDAGASLVRYDQFQTSWATALTPSLRFDRGWSSVAVRSSWLRFQSGHRELHGSVIATTFTPPLGRLRGEVTADGGASRYLTFPTFTHLLLGARAHFLAPQRGAWAGGAVGRGSIGDVARTADIEEMGAWTSRPMGTIVFTARHSHIGDTTYVDFVGTAHVTRDRVELDGDLGARALSHFAGRGVYADVSATVALARHVGLVVAIGRYPTDPTRGTIAGRHFTVGIHMSTTPLRPALSADASGQYLALPRGHASTEGPQDPTLELGPERGGRRMIQVIVAGVESVELPGDFTDWEPRALSRVQGGQWGIVLPLARGPHHLQVRVNGGPWRAPAGLTRVTNEFGAEVGLLLVP